MSSIKYRHLSRNSAHRRALLRNLVTSLVEHESIHTTYAKAKEAQRLAEKLITLGKKNTNASRQRAQSILFEPEKWMSKLFGPLATRYATRPGGYTRVLRTEPKNDDAAPSAILGLVDGPTDMRFAMTAKTLVRQRETGRSMNEITAANVRKVTRFRDGGVEELEREVERLKVGVEERKEMDRRAYEEEGRRWEWVGPPGRKRRKRIKKDED